MENQQSRVYIFVVVVVFFMNSYLTGTKLPHIKAVLSGRFSGWHAKQGGIMPVQKHLEHGSFDQPQYLFGNFFSCLLFCLSIFFRCCSM